jgi:hypothetical protein
MRAGEKRKLNQCVGLDTQCQLHRLIMALPHHPGHRKVQFSLSPDFGPAYLGSNSCNILTRSPTLTIIWQSIRPDLFNYLLNHTSICKKTVVKYFATRLRNISPASLIDLCKYKQNTKLMLRLFRPKMFFVVKYFQRNYFSEK